MSVFVLAPPNNGRSLRYVLRQLGPIPRQRGGTPTYLNGTYANSACADVLRARGQRPVDGTLDAADRAGMGVSAAVALGVPREPSPEEDVVRTVIGPHAIEGILSP
jgi:hypothetical protein